MSMYKSALFAILTLAALVVGGSVAADIGTFSLDASSDQDLVTARTVLSVSEVAPGQSVPAAVVVTIAPGWHINSATPYDDFLIPAEVTFDSLELIVPDLVIYPEPVETHLGESLMSVYDGQAVVRFEVGVAEGTPEGEYILPVRFGYQPCNDRECRAPQELEVPLQLTVGTAGHSINESVFSTPTTPTQSAATAEGTTAGPDDGSQSELERLISEYGFWGYFLVLGLAFVTGLLLSFSPCTYPMIPITVSIFAGQERSVGRGFFLSLIYVGTMAIVYGIMGLIVSLVGGVFGAWLASPPVVIGIAVIFVVFALSMFGLYELNVPSSLRNKLGTTKTGGGVVGSIILGIVAALVVSPCVGPFVAGILLYIATNGSPVIGFLTLFIFAMGLGTLFIVIGTFSSAINRLPRSGEWMEQVKKFFGFVLLLMAIFFLRTLVSDSIIAMVTALVLLAFGVFGGGLDRLTPESGFFPRLKKFLGVLAILAGAYLFLGSLLNQGFILPAAGRWMPSGDTHMVEESGITGWETDLDAGLARAKAENRPVIIDTWATWCANCRVLEKKTFRHAGVGAAAERFVPIKVQLESEKSPETIAFKERFGLKTYTLPTTVLIRSDGSVHRIIPGVIGPEDFIAELKKVN